MCTTTDAIVLSLQPQSDKAHILHAYTRAYGRVSYKVFGLGRKHAIGLYSPLSLLQITASYPASRPAVIKEAARLPYSGTLSSAAIYKQTVSLFVSEVIFHTLRYPMSDEPMFDFLAQSVRALETTEEPQNFHLYFLAGFAARLGFAIEEGSSLAASLEKVPGGLTRQERQQLLNRLCDYFAAHVDTWQPPRSLEVLTEVFDD